MKQQTTALVLCALLFTTFGHELLNRHREAQSSRIAHSPLRSHVQNRDSKPVDEDTLEQCIAQCHNDSTGNPGNPGNPVGGNTTVSSNLTVIVNVTTNIIIFINETAEVAIVFDLNAKLVLLVNVTAQIAVLFDYTQGNGTYYENVQLNVTDGAGLEALLLRITSLTDISVIVGSQMGTSFSTTSIRESFSAQIEIILVAVGYQVSGTNQTAIAILINIGVSISASWSVVSSTITGGRLDNATDLGQFIGRLTVVAIIISEIQTNINITLDIVAIASASSGVELLIYVIGVIISTGDSGVQYIRNSLESNERFFLWLSVLSANSSSSFSAFLIVIARIQALANRNVTIDVVIQVLIDYYYTRPNGSAISRQFNVTVSAFLEYLVQVNLSDTCVGRTLRSIQTGNWVVASVNISAVILILVESAGAIPIDAIVRILVLLAVVISIEVSIATLVIFLFRLLVVNAGIYILIVLIPSIAARITGDFATVFRGILRRINLRALLRGNWLEVIEGVPIFGDIIAAIDTSLKASTSGRFSVSIVFKSSSAAQYNTEILRVFAIIFRFYLNISVSAGGSTRGHLAHAKEHLTHEIQHLAHGKHHGNEKHNQVQHARQHVPHLHEKQHQAVQHEQEKHQTELKHQKH